MKFGERQREMIQRMFFSVCVCGSNKMKSVALDR